ncbi:glycoside hydrolase [uncultured Arcticibacterium sp.]|uniref:glycoside hydrolase n=1 Tax=uncultured Arcticibacterium sp. TaxID=2173042 RepID=UPI0030F5F796
MLKLIRKFRISAYSVILLGSLSFFSFTSCGSDSLQTSPVINPEIDNAIKVNALTDRRYQEIENFGASDAWACAFVGEWPSAKKEAIAELLFSKELDNSGNPKGIGLSLWRFNLGAGSAEQGAASDIKDEWRRGESFLNADGTYDWTRQAGQVWFAEEAKKYGVEKLLAFTNSPPVSMTRNGKAYANNSVTNLAAENYQDFAKYLSTVLKNLKERGLEIDYISPINEPQWDWSKPNQEGTPFYNNEIAGVVRALDAALEADGLNTTIDLAEAGKINYLFEDADKPGIGSQIQAFFNESSADYIGNLRHVARNLSAHSYFTTSPFQSSVEMRSKLKTEIEKVPDLSLWMSEYCILGGNSGEIQGNGRDLGITPALYVARVIHNDLAVANASAWNWWTAVSGYDYKDGLVYVDKNNTDGNYYESKILWALGNYSRFIRPGFERVEVSIDGKFTQNEDFLVSAYEEPETKEMVYVFVNSGTKAMAIALNTDGNKAKTSKAYVTSETADLAEMQIAESGELSIPAESVVTVLVNN